MSDSELISRINASAENQFEGSLESWICRRCSKNVAGPSENPQQRKASVPTQKTTIILIDDSDEIEMLDSPPVGRAAETARSSSVQPFSAKPTTVPRRLENIQHSRPLSSSRFPGKFGSDQSVEITEKNLSIHAYTGNYSADHRQHGLDGKGNNDGSIPNNIDAPSSVNARDKSKTQSELPDRKKLRTESGPISASFKLSSRDLPPNLTHYRPSSLSSIATINSTSSSKSVSPAPTRNPSRNASLAPFSQLTLDDRNRSRTLSVAPGRQAEDTPRASPTNILDIPRSSVVDNVEKMYAGPDYLPQASAHVTSQDDDDAWPDIGLAPEWVTVYDSQKAQKDGDDIEARVFTKDTEGRKRNTANPRKRSHTTRLGSRARSRIEKKTCQFHSGKWVAEKLLERRD